MHYQSITYGDATTLTVIGNTVATVISETHPKYEAIRDYFEATAEADHDEAYVSRLVDVSSMVGLRLTTLSDRVAYANGVLYFDTEPVHGSLQDRIVSLVRASDEAEQVDILVKFLENLARNPNAESREELWSFLGHSNYTLTRRGTFIGYKSVRANRDSCRAGVQTVFVNGEAHVGHVPNPDGAFVQMSRADTDSNRREACSNGLHVGTHSHAFGFGGDVLLAVEVNPADVVAVPKYETTKLRTRAYKVLGEISGEYQGQIWEEDDLLDDVDQADLDALNEEFEDTEDAGSSNLKVNDPYFTREISEREKVAAIPDPAVKSKAAKSTPTTVEGWARIDKAYALALRSDKGHKALAREYPQYGSEASVRRYRKRLAQAEDAS